MAAAAALVRRARRIGYVAARRGVYRGSYRSGAKLFWRAWHRSRPNCDHCSFCSAQFMADVPGASGEGYTTADEYHWICADCAGDFATRFGFTLVGGPAA